MAKKLRGGKHGIKISRRSGGGDLSKTPGRRTAILPKVSRKSGGKDLSPKTQAPVNTTVAHMKAGTRPKVIPKVAPAVESGTSTVFKAAGGSSGVKKARSGLINSIIDYLNPKAK